MNKIKTLVVAIICSFSLNAAASNTTSELVAVDVAFFALATTPTNPQLIDDVVSASAKAGVPVKDLVSNLSLMGVSPDVIMSALSRNATYATVSSDVIVSIIAGLSAPTSAGSQQLNQMASIKWGAPAMTPNSSQAVSPH
jgi:hypothetical protein